MANDSVVRIYYAETPVTAFLTGTRYNYLTCLSYAPYTGVQCGMHGVMDNGKDIEMAAELVKKAED